MEEIDIINYINNKIQNNKDFIRITFFEVRIKLGLNEEQTNDFLRITMKCLSDLNYNIYLTNSRYTYNGASQFVQVNELLVAFKEAF